MTRTTATPERTSPRANPRTCIGCRAVRERAAMVRVRLDEGGAPVIGVGGRGAWLCRDSVTECCALAIKRGGFPRAFRRPVSHEALTAFSAEVGIAAQRGTGERLG